MIIGQARDVEVTTRHYALERDNSQDRFLDYPGAEDIRDTSKTVSYLPREGKTYHMWYRQRLMLVSRETKENRVSFSNPPSSLKIRYVSPDIQKIMYTDALVSFSIFALDQRILSHLLDEAKLEYRAAKENVISVWASDRYNAKPLRRKDSDSLTSRNSWLNITSNPKRDMRTVILDPGTKERLLDDAREFLDSQPWYAARGSGSSCRVEVAVD